MSAGLFPRCAAVSEPGEIRIGEFAHIRYQGRQHRVVAVDPAHYSEVADAVIDQAEPVRLACGRRTWIRAVWHDPPKPHLPRCRNCEGVS